MMDVITNRFWSNHCAPSIDTSYDGTFLSLKDVRYVFWVAPSLWNVTIGVSADANQILERYNYFNLG